MKNNFGKNNFDQLEAAGLSSEGDDDIAEQQAKLTARINDIDVLTKQLTRIKVRASGLHLQTPKERKHTLSVVTAAVDKLLTNGVPVGTKRYVIKCANELNSLKEGVFSGAACDRNTLSVLACGDAIDEVKRVHAKAKARLETLTAASDADTEKYYKDIGDKIQKYAPESKNLDGIKDKPFLVARSPVIPMGVTPSHGQMTDLGFKVDTLDGYVVMHGQIVIGINSAFLKAKNSSKPGAHHNQIIEAAHEVAARISKAKNERMFFVSDDPIKYKSASWFWLMTAAELKRFARCFPSKSVRITSWGFAFN